MLSMQRKLSTPFLVLLALPSTAMGFALSVQISVLSWLLSTQYGLDIHEIGIVWAAGPLAGIIGQLLVGIISDGVWLWGGRRRPFILVGGALSALMLLALPSIGLISRALGLDAILGVAIAVALALDLSINVSFNPTRAIIADVTPLGEKRTLGYTWMQTVSGSFGVLAYAIGAVFGNISLIYIAVGIVLLFSIVPALLIHEPRHLSTYDSSGAHSQPPIDYRALLITLMPLWAYLVYDLVAMALRLAGIQPPGLALEITCAVLTAALIAKTLLGGRQITDRNAQGLSEFRKVLAAHSLSWIGVQTMFVYMISFVQFRFPGLDATQSGQLLSISFLVLNAVAALAPTTLLGPLSVKFGQVPVHATCLFVMAAGYAGVYLLGFSPLAIYVCMAFMGIGWAAIVSLPFAIMSAHVDPARIGLYMGVFNLSVVLPQLVVSLGVGSLISSVADKGMVFMIGAITVGLSACGWLMVRNTAAQPTAAGAAPAASH